MSRICELTGKKDRMTTKGRHASGKSRAGAKAFAYKGPQGLRGVAYKRKQKVNLVSVKTPAGRVRVSMKAYKRYFKKAWTPEIDLKERV